MLCLSSLKRKSDVYKKKMYSKKYYHCEGQTKDFNDQSTYERVSFFLEDEYIL